MNVNEHVLGIIVQHPGTSESALVNKFGLSQYRLHRIFRHIERTLKSQTVVNSEVHGVWIIDVDNSRCMGMEWIGADCGAYHQCEKPGQFPDHRCYEHSNSESPEMVALHRGLMYLTGPGDPSARSLSQLTLEIVQDLLSTLQGIVPLTLKDSKNKVRLARLLSEARESLAWKDKMRQRQTEGHVPPEFHERHSHSSVNTFAYSLKKYFTVLGVPINADRNRVLKAWKRLAMRYHPDVTGHNGDEEKMKEVNLAKERIFRVKGWD